MNTLCRPAVAWPQGAYNIPFTQRYAQLSCRAGMRRRRCHSASDERCDRHIHAARALKGSCGQRQHALMRQRLDELRQGYHATTYDEPQLIQKRASRIARSDSNVRTGQPHTAACCVASLRERRCLDAGMSLTADFSYVSGCRSEAFWRGVSLRGHGAAPRPVARDNILHRPPERAAQED